MSDTKQSLPAATSYHRTLAGVQMPGLIYGTAWKEKRTADLVFKAVKLGFRGIDTAAQPKHYQEEGVGEALRKLQEIGIPRQALFIQTKFTPLAGQDPLRVPYDAKARLTRQVAQSFASSQQNLGTDYVDSLVLHSPLADRRDFVEVWKAMEALYNQGLAKQLGISNCYDLATLQGLFHSAKVKPAVLQNRFYADTLYDRPLRTWCQDNGVIYQSFWTLTANPHILRHPTVQKAAKKLDKTAAQIFLRYTIQRGIVPLTGTSSEQHMIEDLAIFSFQLPEDLILEIDTLLV